MTTRKKSNQKFPSPSVATRKGKYPVLQVPLAPVVIEFARAAGFRGIRPWMLWLESEANGGYDLSRWVDVFVGPYENIEAAAFILETGASPILDPFGTTIFDNTAFGTGKLTREVFDRDVKTWTTPSGDYELAAKDIQRMQAMATAALAHDGRKVRRLAESIAPDWNLVRDEDGHWEMCELAPVMAAARKAAKKS